MLARKHAFDTYDEPRRPEKPNRKPPKRKKPKTSGSKPGYVFLVLLISAVGIYFLSGYAKITSIRTDINEMENQKAELEKEKLNLKADLEGIKSSEKIVEEAMLKLGMNHPTEDQILYVSVPQDHNRSDGLYRVKSTLNDVYKKVKSLIGR